VFAARLGERFGKNRTRRPMMISDFINNALNWWNSLPQETRVGVTITIVSGLVVAVILGIVTKLSKIPQHVFRFIKSLIEKKSKHSGQRTTIPQPPPSMGNLFVQRSSTKGRNLVKQIKGSIGLEHLVSIWGSGGVGKTTVAIEVANSLKPIFTDGIIWINAGLISSFNLSRLQDEICMQLGQSKDALPFDDQAKASVARRLVTGAR
jgi:NB-ARC domain